MRTLSFFIFLGLIITAFYKAEAKEKPARNSRDVSFEDLLVQGKYHFSDEAVTTVEQDKVLDALLGVRKDFKDRIKRSATKF